jgi:nitrogen regulatory protein PII
MLAGEAWDDERYLTPLSKASASKIGAISKIFVTDVGQPLYPVRTGETDEDAVLGKINL